MKTLAAIILIFYTSLGAADSLPTPVCQLTPALWSKYPPPTFITSNNLRRKVGSYKFAQGQFINITGQVLDSNCTPVTGAVVRIWQTNAMGVYEDDSAVFDNKDPNFAGSGTSITDNLGRYSFLTVMPASEKSRTPHIKFSIYHQDLPAFETEMFFPNQYLNSRDPTIKRQLNIQNRKLLLAKHIGYANIDNADLYEFNITLEGNLNYKQ